MASSSYAVSGPSMYGVQRRETMRKSTVGTIKPAPPPKPSHLSSAFTGTLNSEALKSYIRQQSQATISKRPQTDSSCGTDTFKTSRQGSSQLFSTRHDEDDDEDGAWGTAKQTQSTNAAKPALADLFSMPFTVAEDDALAGMTSSQFTLKGVQAAVPISGEEIDVQVATIKLRKSSPNGAPLADLVCGNAAILDGPAPRRQGSETSTISSSNETLRSRQPSILSRLSMFEDDEDADCFEASNGSTLFTSPDVLAPTAATPSSLSVTTPRKQWMHARDGSAFERASPRIPHPTANKVGNVQSRVAAFENAAKTVGLPTVSDGMPLLVAGPPPMRPKSIVLNPSVAGKDANDVEQVALRKEEESKAAEVEYVQDQKRTGEQRDEVEEAKKSQAGEGHAQPSALTRGVGRRARALYAFDGERMFNELTLLPGQMFEVLKEDVQDGWSMVAAEQDGVWTKGLIPQGWYTYVQEFTASPMLEPEQNNYQGPTSQITLNGTSKGEETLASGPSLLVPMVRSHSEVSSSGGDAQAKRLDNRPASGVGQMSVGSNGARQFLEQISTVSTTNGHQSQTQMQISSRILPHSIKEASGEESSLGETTSNTPSKSSSSIVLVPDVSIEDVDTSMTELQSNASATHSSWRPPGLLGGRSLNRFSPYVLSGAEQYILSKKAGESKGDRPDETQAVDPGTNHQIISGAYGGPAWKQAGLQLIVEVHSPEVHVDDRNKEYTAYVVHTSYVRYDDDKGQVDQLLLDPFSRPEHPTYTASVFRRFNQFRWLYNYVTKFYPAIALSLPPMPSATSHGVGWTARFEAEFVERRRRHLQSWLTCIVRHPILCEDRALRFFLEDESEGDEWNLEAKRVQKGDGSLQRLYTDTVHPMFNVDAIESANEAQHFARFNEVYEQAMTSVEGGMLPTVRDVRQSSCSNGDAYRQLSLSILRLITGAHSSASMSKVRSPGRAASASSSSSFLGSQFGILPPMGNVGKRDASGATNEDRAWCWREGCIECRKLTSALQVTAEAFQVVADDHRAHVERGLFDVHDRLWNASKAQHHSAALLEVHKNALSMFNAATGDGQDDFQDSSEAERVAASCETVLNVTMSEIDRMHADRVQTWNAVCRQMLDETIAFHSDALHNLRRARARVDDALGVATSSNPIPAPSRGPILPSPYETQLSTPVVTPTLEMPSMTLTHPSAASKAIHPVTFASEVLSDWLGGGQAIK